MIPLAKMHIEEDIDVSLVTIESENVPLPEVMEQIDLELLQQKVALLKRVWQKKKKKSKQRRKR
jgi:hypothetical protein